MTGSSHGRVVATLVRGGHAEVRGARSCFDCPLVAVTAAALLCALLTSVAAVPSAVASVNVGAILDRNTARVGEQIVLTIEVEGETRNVQEPVLPALPGFDVYGGGQSQRVSFVNGQVSASHSFTYYLVARREGRFTVPPLEVVVDGNTYKSVELSISVLAAGQSQPRSDTGRTPAPSPEPNTDHDYFVTMAADADTVVLGQQVVLTFAFYRATRSNSFFENPEYTPPTTEGFWREDLPPERHSTRVLRSRRYNVTEIRYALFPTRAGDLTIGEAVVRMPEDVFRSFFRRRTRGRGDQFLRAPGFTIHVKPLPPGAPPGFDGTVGSDLELTARVDRDELAAGDALTLSIALEGDGYLSAARSPEVPELPDFRVHDAGSSVDSRPGGDGLHGRLTVDKLLIPTEEGRKRIPGLEYVYYDTRKQRYVTLTSRDIPLRVLPAATPTSSVFAGGGRSEIELLAQDILHIQPISGTLRPYEGPLPRRAVFWTLLALPALVWLGSGVLVARRDRLLADPQRLRRARALRTALGVLAAEGDDAAPDGSVATRVDGSLRTFVAARSGREAAGLSQVDIETWLRASGLGDDVQTRFLSVLQRCDQLRFAGSSEQAGALLSEAETLLRDIAGRLERA